MIYDLITKYNTENIVVAPYATVRFLNLSAQRSIQLSSDGFEAREDFIKYVVEGACRLIKRMTTKEDEVSEQLMDAPPVVAIGVPHNDYVAARHYLTNSKEDFEPWTIVRAQPHVKPATVGLPKYVVDELVVMIYPLAYGETHIGLMKNIATVMCAVESNIEKSNVYVFAPTNEMVASAKLCDKILNGSDFSIDFVACSIHSESTRGTGHDTHFHPLTHRWF